MITQYLGRTTPGGKRIVLAIAFDEFDTLDTITNTETGERLLSTSYDGRRILRHAEAIRDGRIPLDYWRAAGNELKPQLTLTDEPFAVKGWRRAVVRDKAGNAVVSVLMKKGETPIDALRRARNAAQSKYDDAAERLAEFNRAMEGINS